MLNVCLLGDFSNERDEGFKNISHSLATELEQKNNVTRLNIKRIITPIFWRQLLTTQPQIIHILSQPTDFSLIAAYLVHRLRPSACLVISALRTERYFVRGKILSAQRRILGWVNPNLILVQTPWAEALFKQAGCSVALLPNGVDLERFKPVSIYKRQELRQKYELDIAKPVVLHVGHLERARNLAALRVLSENGIQVLVIGSLYMGTDKKLIQSLERPGFRILKGYQSQVAEFYALADCYVFPTQPGNSLTMPLSILEAMACNLPVITTRFSGIESTFPSGKSLIFLDRPTDLLLHVQAVLNSTSSPATREMVQAFSWTAITARLQTYYFELLRQ